MEAIPYTEEEVSEIWHRFLSLDCIPEGKFLKVSEEELRKGYQCRLCKGLVLNPVSCRCPDEASVHLAGKECVKKRFNKETLQKEICQYFYPLNTYFEDEFMKDQLNQFTITCPFCPFSGKIFRVREHVLKECELDGRTVQCPFPECKVSVKRKDLRQHLLSQVSKHVEMLKGYGLDCYINLYVESLARRYEDLTTKEVKGI